MELLETRALLAAVPPPPGLVSWWSGDGHAFDIVAGNHGTLQDGATFDAGKVGQAFRLDGIDDFVRVPHDPSLNPASGMTIEAWINSSSSGGARAMVSKWNDITADRSYILYKELDTVDRLGIWLAEDFDGYIADLQGERAIPSSTWTHVAASFDTNSVRIYFNGSLDQELTVGPDRVIHSSVTDLLIGAVYSVEGVAGFFAGLIDEVVLYNRALTANEIQAVYNAGADGKIKPKSIGISDATLLEGDEGTTNAVFTVFRGVAEESSSVAYSTADGSATTSGSDYTSASGTITFAPGEVSKIVTVVVHGDFAVEPDETFTVNLSNLTTGWTISDAQGVGTILNDDPIHSPVTGHYYKLVPTDPDFTWLEARDAPAATTFTDSGGSVLHGYLATITSRVEDDFLFANFGQFKNLWTGASDAAVEGEWRWVTGPEGLTDGNRGLLFWRGGPSGTTIGYSNWIAGEPNDTSDEEYMDWNHADPAGDIGWNDTAHHRSDISGYIVEFGGDYQPILITDVAVVEGDSGTTDAVFTVTIPKVADVSVDYSTADSGAVAGSDYRAVSGTLAFRASGPRTQTITIPILGDTIFETDEVFHLVLSNVSNPAVAVIGDDRGTATILNDDPEGPPIVRGWTKIASNTGVGPPLAVGDEFGIWISLVGDLDADGASDLVVGALGDDTGGPGRGSVHVLFLNSDGTVKSWRKIAHQTGGGPPLADGDGFSLPASLGDLDGDGVTDLAVGAVSDDTGGSGRGAVYVLFMNADGTVKSRRKIAHQTSGGPSLVDYDRFSFPVGLGDLDNDGVNDMAVGADMDDTRGAVYILFMNSDGTVKRWRKIAHETGGGPALGGGVEFGRTAPLSDLDEDGVTEIAVGAPSDDTGGRGAVYVLFMNSDGTVKNWRKIAHQMGGGPALASGDNFGRQVSSVGDLDGDGVSDLAVGAVGDDTGGFDRGAVYLLLLNRNGTVKSWRKIAHETGGGPTLADNALFGRPASLGDLNGDGTNDLAVGAQLDNGTGAVYVLFLNPIDGGAPAATIAINRTTVPEANGAATVTATLSAISTQAVMVQLAFSGTATFGTDYAASATQIVIPPGSLSGSVTITAVQDTRDEPDETVVVAITNVTNGQAVGTQQVTTTILDDDEPTLTVTALNPMPSGFTAEFATELDASGLNLYDTQIHGLGPADVLFEGAVSGPIAGSLVVDPSRRRVTFLKSGGPLEPDTYTVTLRSAADAFVDVGGQLLDGNDDGITGDDYVGMFTVSARAASAITIGIPDFVRGPGQPVNLPADATTGIPVTISGGTNVRAIDLRISYDPALLNITGAAVGPGMPGGASVTVNTRTPGLAIVVFFSPVALPAGGGTFLNLQAAIPAGDASGIYEKLQTLDVHTVTISDGNDNEFPVIADDAVHLVSYFADVSGNGRINASDAAQVAQFAALIDTGFAASFVTDPILMGDISGNGRVNAADASLVAQFAALINVPEIPPIPSGTAAAGSVGWHWRPPRLSDHLQQIDFGGRPVPEWGDRIAWPESSASAPPEPGIAGGSPLVPRGSTPAAQPLISRNTTLATLPDSADAFEQPVAAYVPAVDAAIEQLSDPSVGGSREVELGEDLVEPIEELFLGPAIV